VVRYLGSVIAVAPYFWTGRARPWLASTRRLKRPFRYAAADLIPHEVSRAWQLRDGGALILRSRSRDIDMFREVFGVHVYDPPPAATAALKALGRRPHVVDLGGNVGITSVRLRQLFPGADVVTYEPDPANLTVLRRAVEANAGGGEWSVVEACAGTASGSARFITGQYADSHIAAPDESGGVELPVVDAMPDVLRADLLKIDIEGGEWALLADPRWPTLTARALVMEHHGRHCPTDTPRDTATTILRDLGFTVCHLAGSTPTLGALWAWR
jgi:FkbM family methyltransferase